jgi:sialate O-acetylesterase
MQPGMIEQWRSDFNAPDAFFGFVELEPWVGGPTPDFRAAQLAALALPRVGYAQATDAGDPLGPFGSIHPRNKKLIGGRLAAAALALQYGADTVWKSPSYAKGVATGAGATATVTVTLADLPAASRLLPASDHCKTELGVPAAQCAGFYIVGSDAKTYNATAAPGGDGRSLVLTAAVAPGVAAAASSFGWNSWPINTIMTTDNLPLQPWPVTPVA